MGRGLDFVWVQETLRMKWKLALLLLFISTTSFAQSKPPKFEKLVFHTGVCFGFCPVYHLEIQRNRHVRIQVEKAFNRPKEGPWSVDSSRIGYFKCRISRRWLKKIDREIEVTGLRNMQPDSTLCCDGSLKTIILYYKDGSKTYYKTMFPKENMRTLITLLTETAEKKSGKKKAEPFELEQ